MTKLQAQSIISTWAGRSEKNSDALRIYTEAIVELRRRGQKFCIDWGFDNALLKASQPRAHNPLTVKIKGIRINGKD